MNHEVWWLNINFILKYAWLKTKSVVYSSQNVITGSTYIHDIGVVKTDIVENLLYMLFFFSDASPPIGFINPYILGALYFTTFFFKKSYKSFREMPQIQKKVTGGKNKH